MCVFCCSSPRRHRVPAVFSSARPYAAADLGKAALDKESDHSGCGWHTSPVSSSLLMHRTGFKDMFIFCVWRCLVFVKPEEALDPLEPELQMNCHDCWKPNLGSLQEQVLLSTELSLQALFVL